MELNAAEVLKVIKRKGVGALHHANTVQTACAFLAKGRLMARGVVEEKGLPQTPQQSDVLDKKYGLWNDIFLDGIDIHERARGRCFYGPVLFVFDLEVFAQDWLASLWITRTNPQNWTDTQAVADRYFGSIQELQLGYRKGSFDFSLVLRHVGGVLRLKPYLTKVVVDNPHYGASEVQFYSQAIGALKASARLGQLGNLPIEPRVCVRNCKCKDQYREMSRKVLNHLFVP